MAGALRPTVGLLLLVAGTVAAGLASLALSSLQISLHDVVGAFTDYDDSDGQVIVRDVRGQRTLVAIAVGGSLGAAGALIQGMTRNPLADPGILGIEAGAALSVVMAIFLLAHPARALQAGGHLFEPGTPHCRLQAFPAVVEGACAPCAWRMQAGNKHLPGRGPC